MKTMIKTAIATGLLVAGMSAAYAVSQPVTISANATVEDSTNLSASTAGDALSFGTIAIADVALANNQVVVPADPAGTVVETGVTVADATAKPGSVNVAVQTGREVSIAQDGGPFSLYLGGNAGAGSTGTLTVTALTFNNGTTDVNTCVGASNACTFYVGGTLSLPANVQQGTYTGDVSVTLTTA